MSINILHTKRMNLQKSCFINNSALAYMFRLGFLLTFLLRVLTISHAYNYKNRPIHNGINYTLLVISYKFYAYISSTNNKLVYLLNNYKKLSYGY